MVTGAVAWGAAEGVGAALVALTPPYVQKLMPITASATGTATRVAARAA
jgi:hypothetical protein